MRENSNSYQFGAFILDTRSQQLYQDNELKPLPRKEYEILQILIEHRGEIVSREEIARQVWGNRKVEERNMAQHIHMLRRVLGDSSRAPKYVMTIPGKGYIFNHHVTIIESPRETETAIPPGEMVTGDTEAGSASSTDPAPTPTRRRTRFWIPAGIVILAAIAALIYLHRDGTSNNGQTNEVLTTIPIVTLPGIERYPSFSPDERFIAFTSEIENSDDQDVFIKNLETGTVRRITRQEDIDEQPTWSPDGTRLAFLRAQPRSYGSKYRVMLVSANGNNDERQIATASGGIDWSPDGRYLAISNPPNDNYGSTIEVLEVDGDKRQFITSNDRSSDTFDSMPRFSPDGSKIAITRWTSDAACDIHIIDLADGSTTRLTEDKKRVSALEWSSSGREIIFASNRRGPGRLWRIPITGGEPVLVGQIQDEIEHFALGHKRHQILFTQAQNDSLIEIREILPGNGQANGKSRCRIDSSGIDNSPQMSPDGQMVVFISKRSGWNEIWLARSDCTGVQQLTDFRGTNLGSPKWSSDGSRIFFDRYTNDQADIFSIAINGSDLRQLTTSPHIDIMPSLSNNGEVVYFTSRRNGVYQIWKVPVNGGDEVQVTINGGREAVESSDGRILYYTRDDVIWQKNLESGIEELVRPLNERIIGRYWSVTPSAVYFVPKEPGVPPIVMRLDLTTGQIHRVFVMDTSLSRWTPGISVTRDGGRIATSGIAYRFGDILAINNWQ